MNTLLALQASSAAMTAAATIFGAIVVFILLYMVLERKKKTLIFVLLMALAGYGIFYWRMSNPPIDQMGNPVPTGPTVMSTATAPSVVPVRPHAKKQAVRPACPLKTVPYTR